MGNINAWFDHLKTLCCRINEHCSRKLLQTPDFIINITTIATLKCHYTTFVLTDNNSVKRLSSNYFVCLLVRFAHHQHKWIGVLLMSLSEFVYLFMYFNGFNWLKLLFILTMRLSITFKLFTSAGFVMTN